MTGLDDYPDILDRESKNPFRLLSVLELLKQQNPGVSAIRFPYNSEWEEWDPDFDWEAAGQCVGASPFIKYLSISFEPSTCSMGLIPFCRGLANNRSIIRLDMYIDFHDYVPEKDIMFTILRPFFANNDKLEHLRIESQITSWISDESIDALCARSTLKQLHYDGCNNSFDSGLICTLIKTNKSLEKLSLGSDCLIDDDISSVLESTLSNADCRLKSLSLDNFFVELPGLGVDREMDVTGIARGLGLNNSINHLKCTGRYSQVLLGDRPNDSLKVLDIDLPEQFCEQLSNSMKRFSSLKKLKIANDGFGTIKSGVLSSIIKEVLTPSSKLEEFFIPEYDDDSLKVLGECICLNKTLKTLSFVNDRKVTSAGWTSFLQQLARSGHSLESLDLTGCELGDATRDLNAFIKVSPSLKSLKLFCINITPGDFDALVAVFNKANVERIGVSNTNDIFYRLIEAGRFTSVDLGYSSTLEEYSRIARAIESPNCQLEEISGGVNITSQREMLEVTTAWARVLGTNSTLKSIDIWCSFERSGCSSQFGRNIRHTRQMRQY